MADPRNLLYGKQHKPRDIGARYQPVKECMHKALEPFEPQPTPDDYADAMDAVDELTRLAAFEESGIAPDEYIDENVRQKPMRERVVDPLIETVRRWFDAIQEIHIARIGGMTTDTQTTEQQLIKLKELVGNGSPLWLQNARKLVAERTQRMSAEAAPSLQEALRQLELAFIMVSSEKPVSLEHAELQLEQRQHDK